MDGSFFLKAKIFLNILFQSLRYYFSFLGEALRPSLQQLCANILGYLNTKGLYPSLKVSYLTVIASLENVLSGRLILLKNPHNIQTQFVFANWMFIEVSRSLVTLTETSESTGNTAV